MLCLTCVNGNSIYIPRGKQQTVYGDQLRGIVQISTCFKLTHSPELGLVCECAVVLYRDYFYTANLLVRPAHVQRTAPSSFLLSMKTRPSLNNSVQPNAGGVVTLSSFNISRLSAQVNYRSPSIGVCVWEASLNTTAQRSLSGEERPVSPNG